MTFRKLCASTALMSIAAGSAFANTDFGYADPFGPKLQGPGQKIHFNPDSDPKVGYVPKRFKHRVENRRHTVYDAQQRPHNLQGIGVGNVTLLTPENMQIPTHFYKMDENGRHVYEHGRPAVVEAEDLTYYPAGSPMNNYLNCLYHVVDKLNGIHDDLEFIKERHEVAGKAVPARISEALAKWGSDHILIGVDFMEEMNAFFAMNGPLTRTKELIMCRFMGQDGKPFNTVRDINVVIHEIVHGVCGILFPELFTSGTYADGGFLEGYADLGVLGQLLSDSVTADHWVQDTGGNPNKKTFVDSSGELMAPACGMPTKYFRNAELTKMILTREEGDLGAFPLDESRKAIGSGREVHNSGEALVSPMKDIFDETFQLYQAAHPSVSQTLACMTVADTFFRKMSLEAAFNMSEIGSDVVDPRATFSRFARALYGLAGGYEENLGFVGLGEIIKKNFEAHNIGVGLDFKGFDELEQEGNRYFTDQRNFGPEGSYKCDRVANFVKQAQQRLHREQGNNLYRAQTAFTMPHNVAGFSLGGLLNDGRRALTRVRHGHDRADEGLGVYGELGGIFGLPGTEEAIRAQRELRRGRSDVRRIGHEVSDLAHESRRLARSAERDSRRTWRNLRNIFGRRGYVAPGVGYGAPVHMAQSFPAAPMSYVPAGPGFHSPQASPRSPRPVAMSASAYAPMQSSCPGGVCPLPSAGYPGSVYASQGQGQAFWGEAVLNTLPALATDVVRHIRW